MAGTSDDGIEVDSNHLIMQQAASGHSAMARDSRVKSHRVQVIGGHQGAASSGTGGAEDVAGMVRRLPSAAAVAAER